MNPNRRDSTRSHIHRQLRLHQDRRARILHSGIAGGQGRSARELGAGGVALIWTLGAIVVLVGFAWIFTGSRPLGGN